MIKILTPQRKLLAKLDKNDVESFLRDRALLGRKVSTGAEIIAFDAGIETALLRMKMPSSMVIRTIKDFSEGVHQKLTGGTTVFVAPTKRTMRHFYSTDGFIRAMESLAHREHPVEVVIPAGQYGDDHVFAIRKPKAAAF